MEYCWPVQSMGEPLWCTCQLPKVTGSYRRPSGGYWGPIGSSGCHSSDCTTGGTDNTRSVGTKLVGPDCGPWWEIPDKYRAPDGQLLQDTDVNGEPPYIHRTRSTEPVTPCTVVRTTPPGKCSENKTMVLFWRCLIYGKYKFLLFHRIEYHKRCLCKKKLYLSFGDMTVPSNMQQCIVPVTLTYKGDFC